MWSLTEKRSRKKKDKRGLHLHSATGRMDPALLFGEGEERRDKATRVTKKGNESDLSCKSQIKALQEEKKESRVMGEALKKAMASRKGGRNCVHACIFLCKTDGKNLVEGKSSG